MADEDTSNGMLSANVAQAPNVVFAIRARECCVRLRRQAQLVGEREAKPLAAVVDGQNALWSVVDSSWFVIWHAVVRLNWRLNGQSSRCNWRLNGQSSRCARGNHHPRIIIRDISDASGRHRCGAKSAIPNQQFSDD
jgi:hypothetical protein